MVQLGQNAFIYIQKSQVKYTYVLLTIDARVNGCTRVSFSFLACGGGARAPARHISFVKLLNSALYFSSIQVR